jgi:hypothetical protein
MRSTHPPYRRAASGFRLSLLAASRHHAINSSSGFTALPSVIGGPSSAFIAVAMPDGSSFPTQQALLQVLQKRWDRTFSEHSYGFRPGRSAHQAVAQAQRYIAAGYNVVVDLDLEKFLEDTAQCPLVHEIGSKGSVSV